MLAEIFQNCGNCWLSLTSFMDKIWKLSWKLQNMEKNLSNIVEFVFNIPFCHHFTSYFGLKKWNLFFCCDLELEISAEVSWFQNPACGNFFTFLMSALDVLESWGLVIWRPILIYDRCDNIGPSVAPLLNSFKTSQNTFFFFKIN